ncbi:hypothetical protein [Bacillus sp. MMSF_3328]|uniref:hypothetical protein n=1 Tax=Bacillus sp. MMSF_3328 TaxID=3047080 RepID=UPI00273E24A3|nr:hypothetical protein [Bacillus sp. MMSF_3328]
MTEANIYVPVRVTAEPIADDQWEAVMSRINRHSLDPLTKEDVFTFSGICSNDRMDAYLTRMDPVTTLRNYVEDLQGGIPLQEGHDIYKNPYGRSYDAEFLESSETDNANSVRGHWYVLRDLTINGVPTNDTIRAIRGGIIKDMSVGFGGNKTWYRCSSCGRDIFDWECPHIPGLEDEHGRMSFSWVVDGRLREVSTVYNGATPGAYIDKARAFVEQGELSRENIVMLERKFQVRLDDGKRSIFMPKKEGNRMDLLAQIRQALQEGKIEKARLYEVLSAEGETFRQPDDIAIRNELGEQCSVDGIKQLKSEAEMGRTYMVDLIDQAVAARVKAQGEKFNAEQYKQMLVRVNDMEFIKGEIDSYEKQALERFTPGRQTAPDDLDGEDPKEVRSNPVKPIDENIFD